MSATSTEAVAVSPAPRRRKRLPWWVWLICTLMAVWLGMALYGQLIREKKVADPVEVRKEQQAKEADDAGEPLPGTVQALGDLDLPPVRPEPVSADDDRGSEVLIISQARCEKLNKTFKPKWTSQGCEVYVHEIKKEGDMLFVMASPTQGVQENGRPIITILPASAYKEGGL